MKGTLIRSQSKRSVGHCSSRFWDRCVLQCSGDTANAHSCIIASHCTLAEFSDVIGLLPARGRRERRTKDKPREHPSCTAQDMWASYWGAKRVTNNMWDLVFHALLFYRCWCPQQWCWVHSFPFPNFLLRVFIVLSSWWKGEGRLIVLVWIPGPERGKTGCSLWLYPWASRRKEISSLPAAEIIQQRIALVPCTNSDARRKKSKF